MTYSPFLFSRRHLIISELDQVGLLYISLVKGTFYICSTFMSLISCIVIPNVFCYSAAVLILIVLPLRASRLTLKETRLALLTGSLKEFVSESTFLIEDEGWLMIYID